ncbi:DUF1684 domain-containing protein [Amnibacterium kyonggiense]|uniref:DUF1684 domain-containing protein n=1 Tax=Amnibacterium kyonggiense TaxID=595671 RepID=A0A4R7FQA6_9MICO|nr:DUF1684 domain-containing protein [Amnibacterium kyonggiense]TDS79960.1 hypothetical protein CLV52_0506 [Amnibacterium kyonggiense]
MDLVTALDVADWRRRTHALYEAVRESRMPEGAWKEWRAGRDAMFRDHPASPLQAEDRDGFAGLVFPDYDPAWRFETLVEEAEPAHLDVPTGTDGVVPFDRVGVVRLGDLGTLDVWWLSSYGNGLFIPVKDASAGRPGGTYGGGRYLIDTGKGADLGLRGRDVVIDLNFAYNPSCAYDPEWACPLAPPGNTLRVEVPVGERVFNTDY